MKLNHYNINFNFSNFGTVYKIISLNRSIMRITHNLFLRNKKISGRIANVGSGANIDLKNMFKEVNGKIYNYDYFKYNKNVTRVNLEKKINLSKNKFDFIILFNVLEHIENYKNLINNLKYYLKKKGTLEIFVPFMFRFHEDPKDYFRPTHFYLQKLLSRKKFFSIKTTLIAAGPMMTVLEILFKYLKFKIVKIIFLFFFIILDKIFFKFSKDYLNYYCGVHISCKRI